MALAITSVLSRGRLDREAKAMCPLKQESVLLALRMEKTRDVRGKAVKTGKDKEMETPSELSEGAGL